jgi:isopenicillin N synthase-like dioxygenase
LVWKRISAGNRHVFACRGLLHEYSESCKRVKDGILRAVARLLDLDDDGGIVGQLGERGSTNARFNYYPACPRPDLVLGVSPHNDACVLTLLLMDEHVGGLQFHRDGTWYGVPPVRGPAVLVIIGGSLEVNI